MLALAHGADVNTRRRRLDDRPRTQVAFRPVSQAKFLLLTAFGLLACGAPQGWTEAERTGGPRVIWDFDARPLPDIPLPNDLAMRVDPSSPTGLRVNVSTHASTEHERDIRRKFNTLDGFGTYAPISVGFDKPLDIENLFARHADNDDFRDDAVYLLNIDESCARYGEEIALDIGKRRFPITMWQRSSGTPDPEAPDGVVVGGGNLYFPLDAHGDSPNLLFEDRNEDRNGNGALDPGEDVDQDGVLDVANLRDPAACDGIPRYSIEHHRCLADQLLTFYERETNSLVLWPLWPLEQRCKHAVVLTKRLVGEDGRPVESPFASVNDISQTAALTSATGLLGRYGLSVDDVAFAWTYTTGSMTTDLERLRAGLYGAGPFAELAEQFPVDDLQLWTAGELAADQGLEPAPGTEDRVVAPGGCIAAGLTWLWGQGQGEWEANMCSIQADLAAIGGLFGGSFSAPDLLVDRDGHATPAYPSTHDELWQIDAEAGQATIGTTRPTFWCALPQRAADCTPGNPEGRPFCPPYPTVIYAHGYGGSRAEISLHMGRHAAMGQAACSIDAYGHGLSRMLVPNNPEAQTFSIAQFVFEGLGVPELGAMILRGRDRDLDNDGLPDPGADMWTADIFHTRDMVRQSVLETMQFVRILRSMDGSTRAADGSLLGDVDGDGEVDLGGPDTTIGHWGISLGGILSGVLAGSEPSLDAASPNAGGAGLTQVSGRASQGGVPEAVGLPVLGPLVLGCLATDTHQRPVAVGEPGNDCFDGDGQVEGPFVGGNLRLAFLLNANAKSAMREFAAVEGVAVGDRVVLENLANGERAEQRISERGWLRFSVAADALDPIERRSLIGLSGDMAGIGSASDNTLLGDPLRLTVYVGESEQVRGVIDSFQRELDFQGTRYREGSTLVALQAGLGYQRNTPGFRRFLGLAQHALGPGDPGVWMPHVWMYPLDVSYDPHVQGGNTRVLVMPTAGDSNVPVSTGVAMGRTAGLLGDWRRDETLPPEQGWRELFAVDPRYGTSIDQMLVDNYVVEAIASLQRFPDNPLNPNVIFDADDVSDGTATWSCGPSDWSALIGENQCPAEIDGQEVFFPVPHPPDGAALRVNRPRAEGGYDAFRVPVLRPAGQHGIYNAQAFRTFDADAYMVDFTARFLGTAGGVVSHEPGCDCASTQAPPILVSGDERFYALGNRACGSDDLRVCEAACASAWGIQTPAQITCEP
jgi:hypothetical protein